MLPLPLISPTRTPSSNTDLKNALHPNLSINTATTDTSIDIKDEKTLNMALESFQDALYSPLSSINSFLPLPSLLISPSINGLSFNNLPIPLTPNLQRSNMQSFQNSPNLMSVFNHELQQMMFNELNEDFNQIETKDEIKELKDTVAAIAENPKTTNDLESNFNLNGILSNPDSNSAANVENINRLLLQNLEIPINNNTNAISDTNATNDGLSNFEQQLAMNMNWEQFFGGWQDFSALQYQQMQQQLQQQQMQHQIQQQLQNVIHNENINNNNIGININNINICTMDDISLSTTTNTTLPPACSRMKTEMIELDVQPLNKKKKRGRKRKIKKEEDEDYDPRMDCNLQMNCFTSDSSKRKKRKISANKSSHGNGTVFCDSYSTEFNSMLNKCKTGILQSTYFGIRNADGEVIIQVPTKNHLKYEMFGNACSDKIEDILQAKKRTRYVRGLSSDEKKDRRREQNRNAAARSRARKNAMIAKVIQLHQENIAFRGHTANQITVVKELKEENERLKQVISSMNVGEINN